jgi:CRISPR system Cascade subunit CasB
MTQGKKLIFLKKCSQELIAWHHQLHNDKYRSHRALLRRCATPQEVLMEAPFYDLYALLQPKLEKICLEKDLEDHGLMAIATIAGLLAHVKKHDENKKSFASQLGEGKDKPVLSEFRFKQLQKSRNWEEFYRRLRRAIGMLKDANTNIVSLSDDILHWAKDLTQESRGLNSRPERCLKISWAMDYFTIAKK